MDFQLKDSFFNTSSFQLSEKIIGKGSNATIRIAKDMFNGELYVAKIIDYSIDFNGEAQMRFMRQPTILQKFHHPSIIKFYGINFHSFDNPKEFQPTILLEYLPKGSLKDVLSNENHDSNFTITKRYINLLGISHAMKTLHSYGVIHRNLNPANILLDSDYYPRISGFSNSRSFPYPLKISQSIEMSGNSGTLFYMAPELLNDDINYGAAVDVFAFSILAFEILTGEQPYVIGEDEHPLAVSQKIIEGERPHFTSEVTDRMQELLARCWSEDVLERPPFEEIFEALAADCRSFVSGKVDEEEVRRFVERLNAAA